MAVVREAESSAEAVTRLERLDLCHERTEKENCSEVQDPSKAMPNEQESATNAGPAQIYSHRVVEISTCVYTGDDGWQQVTRKEKRKKSRRSGERTGGPTAEDEHPSCVSCLTGDFGIQNVLLQMGLKLLTPDGVRIRHLSTFGLKCASCFKVTRRVRSLSPSMTSCMTTILLPCRRRWFSATAAETPRSTKCVWR